MMKHWHHILPKHMGGSDDSSNLIQLTIEEHAEAHKKLWDEHGKWQDKIAWKTLSGQISIQDVREKIMKEHNPMHREDVIQKMSGQNHWSKKPGKIHNAKINHPKGNSKKIMINGVVYSSIKSASELLNLDLRKIKKIGKFI